MTEEIAFKDIRIGLDEIFAAIKAQCGLSMAFGREDRLPHQNSHTFYLNYQGPLPTANGVKVDITIKELLVLPLAERPILKTYAGFDDLPDGPTVRVYAKEEIVIEKLLALSDRARNEPRDLYDLWYLLSNNDVRLEELQAEIQAKLEFRGRTPAGIGDAIAAKEARLTRLWATRLAQQMNNLPEFANVFRNVQRSVRNVAFLN